MPINFTHPLGQQTCLHKWSLSFWRPALCGALSATITALLTLLLASCSGGTEQRTPTVPESPLPSGESTQPDFQYFVLGDPAAPVTINSNAAGGSYALVGGGVDVDEAFRWMIARAGIAPGTGGRFVIIRATGTDAYNPYIFYSDTSLNRSGPIQNEWVGGASLGLTSVETLIIPSTQAANDPTVNSIVARANVVFIAGGDQADYITQWSGTMLLQTLKNLIKRRVPLGGTSAGLAVLGQFVFSALHATIYSEEAMANPFDSNLTLNPDPLSLFSGFIAPPELAWLILDSHFNDRDRMGRLITFISRLIAPDGQSGCPGGVLPASLKLPDGARGIGINAETALLVQGNALSQTVSARMVTNAYNHVDAAVYFVRPTVAPSICQAGIPLTINSVDIMKLDTTLAVFDLSGWRGLPIYEILNVDNGTLVPPSWQ